MARQLAPFASAREIAYAAALDVIDAAAAAPIIAASTTNLGTVILTGPISMLAADSITAKASGNHSTATALTAQVNNATKVASDNDSLLLPSMNAGEVVIIANSGAKSAQVFGHGTSTINDIDTDTGVALASGKTGIYAAVTSGKIYGGALA